MTPPSARCFISTCLFSCPWFGVNNHLIMTKMNTRLCLLILYEYIVSLLVMLNIYVCGRVTFYNKANVQNYVCLCQSLDVMFNEHLNKTGMYLTGFAEFIFTCDHLHIVAYPRDHLG